MEIIKVSSKSNPNSVAGALANSLREKDSIEMQAIGAGALNQVKIVCVTNLANTIDKLKEHGFWVVGTALNHSLDYREIDYSGKNALVIGNEGSGISKLVAKKCDFLAKIPMYGKTNSLNASVAAGIMIYEIIRNRK